METRSRRPGSASRDPVGRTPTYLCSVITYEVSAGWPLRVRFDADTPADLDRYLRDHAPSLRAAFASHFPTGGVQLAREVWTDVQTGG